MDRQDFAILAALERAPRASYAELGASVGLSANAAKARVKRMQEGGVLQGFVAIPRASLLGLREGLLVFTGADDLDAREDEVLRGLSELPGVRFTDVGLDHSVHVWLLYRDDADWERIERAAISLVGKPPAALLRSDSAESATHPLAPADWKIVRALQPDGRAQAKDLARRAGLSFKPLKRRLEALLRSGDLRIRPVVSTGEASGDVLFRIVCVLADESVKLPAIEDVVLVHEAPRVVTVLARRPTLRDARLAQRELASAQGVERALLILGSRRASLAWLDEAIARQLAPAPAAPLPMPTPKAR